MPADATGEKQSRAEWIGLTFVLLFSLFCVCPCLLYYATRENRFWDFLRPVSYWDSSDRGVGSDGDSGVGSDGDSDPLIKNEVSIDNIDDFMSEADTEELARISIVPSRTPTKTVSVTSIKSRSVVPSRTPSRNVPVTSTKSSFSKPDLQQNPNPYSKKPSNLNYQGPTIHYSHHSVDFISPLEEEILQLEPGRATKEELAAHREHIYLQQREGRNRLPVHV